MSDQTKHNLLIAYGSATGNAESIAKRLYEEISEQQEYGKLGVRAAVCTLNDTIKKATSKSDHLLLKNHTTVIVVCSTTGNGDAPENADRFLRFIKNKNTPADYCKGKQFAILGLGDTNYDKFCFCGKEIYRCTIKQLQGQELLELALADDATGLEETVEPWIELLHKKLKEHFVALKKQQQSTAATAVGANDVAQEQQGKQVTLDQQAASSQQSPPFSSSCYVRLITEKPAIEAPSHVHDHDHEDGCCNCHFASQFIRARAAGILPTTPVEQSKSSSSSRYSEKSPFMAKVCGVRYLTSDVADKTVLHLELDINDATQGNNAMAFKFKPGDAIGIIPRNPPELVDKLLQRILGTGGGDLCMWGVDCLDAAKRCIIPQHLEPYMIDRNGQGKRDLLSKPVSLRELLLKKVDLLQQVTVPQLRVLALYCSDENERKDLLHLAADQNRFLLTIQRHHADILDILDWYPSCKPDIAHYLQVSQPIRPRYYSISNSPLQHVDQIHIAFSLLSYQTGPPYRLNKKGLCTTHYLKYQIVKAFLDDEYQDDVLVPIFHRESAEFTLETDLSKPIIMVGPGTGIAPFRAFVQHRMHLRKYQQQKLPGGNSRHANHHQAPAGKGREWLFHGCRREQRDFLYREEFTKLEQHQEDGTFAIRLACSQEPCKEMGLWYCGGIYVQDLLYEYAHDIIDMMYREDGVLYVCGDAQSMAKQVLHVLTRMLVQQARQIRVIKEDQVASGLTSKIIPDILSEEDAKAEISRWQQVGKLQQDVWTS